MSKQKKFTSVFEIEVEIIKAKKRMERIRKEAQEFDNQGLAHLLKQQDTDVPMEEKSFWYNEYKNSKLLADKLWKQAESIERVTLSRLKNTLAAMNTQVMPFMEGDKSTVLAEAK